MSDPPSMKYSCVYPLRSRVAREDVDRISQAAVYLTDVIYLPATATVEPTASDDDRADMYTRIRGLHEIGAVRLWTTEDPPQNVGSDARLVFAPADFTVAREDYQALYDQMMTRLMENRDYFRGAGPFDGVAEVVEGKHALFLFGLRDLLDAQGIVLDQRGARTVSRYFTGLVGRMSVAEEVVRRLAMRLRLPDVAQLGIEQIETVRRHMPAFRDRILRSMGDDQLLFDEREAMIQRLTELLVDEFFDYMWQMRGDPAASANPSKFWSLLHLILPSAISRTNLGRFFGWAGREARAPEMLLMEMQRLGRVRSNDQR